MTIIRNSDQMLLFYVENEILKDLHIAAGWGSGDGMFVNVNNLLRKGIFKTISEGNVYSLHGSYTNITHLGIKFAYKYNKIRGTL